MAAPAQPYPRLRHTPCGIYEAQRYHVLDACRLDASNLVLSENMDVGVQLQQKRDIAAVRRQLCPNRQDEDLQHALDGEHLQHGLGDGTSTENKEIREQVPEEPIDAQYGGDGAVDRRIGGGQPTKTHRNTRHEITVPRRWSFGSHSTMLASNLLGTGSLSFLLGSSRYTRLSVSLRPHGRMSS